MAYSIYHIRPTNGWDVPSSNQYHIQTDEGPERYFRYQTDSGQYRKEKRLEDGTVVGTYAWIDDSGFLQKRDYMADNGGYRILKTTNVFVGRNVPIGQAMKTAAKYRGSSGGLPNSSQRPVVTVPYSPATSYVPNAYQSQTPSPALSDVARPYGDPVSNSIVSTTSSQGILPTEAPVVEITPHSIYSTSINPLVLPLSNSTAGINGNNYISTTPLPTISSSQPPSYYQSTTPQPLPEYIPSTPKPFSIDPQLYASQNEASKDINQNSLEYLNNIDSPYRFHNGPTYPLDQNGKPYLGQNLRNGYDPQYSTYDGISVTNDGFRYYIPRAYHEEQTLPGDKRTGSFGYIDPFGIRRVIYYNTAPGTGFQHRKNNRYVGFQATPYDPRPY